MPYYRQADGAPTTLCADDHVWLIDGRTETPVIPVAEAFVASGEWERSDAPFRKAMPRPALAVVPEPEPEPELEPEPVAEAKARAVRPAKAPVKARTARR